MKVSFITFAALAAPLALGNPVPAANSSDVQAPGQPITPRQIQGGGIIPSPMVDCGDVELPEADWKGVIDKIKDYGIHGGKVQPKKIHVEYFGKAAFYMCNCKWFHWDPLPIQEISEAAELITKKCGPHQTGWVWANDWQKGYNIAPYSYVHGTDAPLLCPDECFN
ncbi:hypothetical protein JX265_007403 [Neoarthrinium moseri]|uniref:Uncharacterized protein n=1 Tax=Neoarthrinium moseri TaxID=1658444 RepID=A0A9Q0AL69_9PEZI|nr:uncharacterized protein JN550_009126 [Neoarthrinium moseri]KAI1864106.1 hypothetical protein JN550_009126 [Neoarthrinium moseri]KAI1867601.1 hypothetical protein JX265_007403 [Neoarthrinium moseri]